MTCKECGSKVKRFGKDRSGNQRYRCTQCGKTFLAEKKRLFETMTITEEKALLALQLLVEGNSIRSTERIANLHRDTVVKLLALVGSRCETFSESFIKNVRVQDVQCDEVWSFVGKTRLTNGFSKKWIMLKAALGLHFAYSNFCRVHQTLKVTPAMEAGITDHIWTIRELLTRSTSL